MFEAIHAELTAEMWPFASKIADRDQVLCALTLARQHRIAAANARVERAMLDGIGEVVASIDAELYHRLAGIYGYETVNSPDFLRSLRRDNPDLFRIRNHTKAAHRIVVPEWHREAGADVCTEAAEMEAMEVNSDRGMEDGSAQPPFTDHHSPITISSAA